MLVIPKRPWKNYRKIQNDQMNKEYELSMSAIAVMGTIVLCGIILLVAVLYG